MVFAAHLAIGVAERRRLAIGIRRAAVGAAVGRVAAIVMWLLITAIEVILAGVVGRALVVLVLAAHGVRAAG